MSDEQNHRGDVDGGDGEWVERKIITEEYRRDCDDAIAVTATADRLRAIAPRLQGVSDHRTQSEYLRLAVQFDEIAEVCGLISEGLRARSHQLKG